MTCPHLIEKEFLIKCINSFDENDELFKKTSKELRDERSKYSLYELKLRAKEEAFRRKKNY